jgi:urease accessory protein
MQVRTAVATAMSKVRPLLSPSPRKRGPRSAASVVEQKADFRRRGNRRTENCNLETAALYRLMIWLSPAYPVGAFAYSSGIEWAVESGDIDDTSTLRRWLEAVLSAGTGVSDGIFFAQTYRAIDRGDAAGFVEIAELAAGLVATRERHQETTALGRTFIEVTRAAWPCTAFDTMQRLWAGPIAYPVAVGAACAGHAIPLAPALHAFLIAVTSGWISAGVRLIPLGHTESQRLMKALEPAVAATAQRALSASLDDVGSATFRADLASVRHETQYTRLFRS